jgi:hypothetical protein
MELKPKTSKAKFTEEEDKLLIFLVEQHKKVGGRSRLWLNISRHFPNRSNRQLRERYINNLDPNIDRSEFSQEDFDHLLREVAKYRELRTNHIAWCKISQEFPGRTDVFLKNKYVLIRKRKKKPIEMHVESRQELEVSPEAVPEAALETNLEAEPEPEPESESEPETETETEGKGEQEQESVSEGGNVIENEDEKLSHDESFYIPSSTQDVSSLNAPMFYFSIDFHDDSEAIFDRCLNQRDFRISTQSKLF